MGFNYTLYYIIPNFVLDFLFYSCVYLLYPLSIIVNVCVGIIAISELEVEQTFIHWLRIMVEDYLLGPVLRIRRDNILDSSVFELQRFYKFNRNKNRRNSVPKIRFMKDNKPETGIDLNGLFREWLTLAAAEFFDEKRLISS
mmetsp:Transcript_31556/g.53351  ORF Transcript_31556/g.53351 Transcript_31556/m.53351 type:complete len:142 (+) Transcript_31556:945-1370(+)